MNMCPPPRYRAGSRGSLETLPGLVGETMSYYSYSVELSRSVEFTINNLFLTEINNLTYIIHTHLKNGPLQVLNHICQKK